MLFLLFQLGKEYYALEAAQVGEVLPLMGMKEGKKRVDWEARKLRYVPPTVGFA